MEKRAGGKGYEVRVILKGLGEFEGIRKIFAEHIEEAEMYEQAKKNKIKNRRKYKC